jgi:hypothetical protein
MDKTEKQLLIEANGILRSLYSVVSRKGESTNWEPLEKRLSEILKDQHEYMFPTIQQIRRKKLNNINKNIE